MGGLDRHVDLEIGLVYLELAHRLLRVGGRIGIVLPETYFFSKKYRWLPGWLEGLLMPGQEQVLTTKEVIVLRPGPSADFETFYLLWAMTLKIVRDQWRRVVFMQTNREDVGKRYLEIEIPIPPNGQKAAEVSEPFKHYYETIARARSELQKYLHGTKAHHFFVSGAEQPEPADDGATFDVDGDKSNNEDVDEEGD